MNTNKIDDDNISSKEITITLEDGTTQEGEILTIFEVAGDKYILYSCEQNVYAAKKNDDNTLSPIPEDEWHIIEKIYQEYIDEYEDEEDDNDKPEIVN